MDFHYDWTNFEGDELPAWDFQDSSVPEAIELLLANLEEGSSIVQEGVEAETGLPYHDTDVLAIASKSDVPLGMLSPGASISTVLDTPTGAPVPDGASRSSFEHDVSSKTPLQDDNNDRKCSCFKCRLAVQYLDTSPFARIPCLFKCGSEDYLFGHWYHYVKVHLKQGEHYCCPEHKCTRTFKREADLKRHLQVHCLLPGQYPCDISGCKLGGENGFHRHDKLLSHKRNVHEGKATPDQLMRKRTLLPKA
ncbi:hypothetical protein MMC15_000334 [Xylographa vitiligo]|nr:hypothetical protein [Xylographa vitiligo]